MPDTKIGFGIIRQPSADALVAVVHQQNGEVADVLSIEAGKSGASKMQAIAVRTENPVHLEPSCADHRERLLYKHNSGRSLGYISILAACAKVVSSVFRRSTRSY